MASLFHPARFVGISSREAVLLNGLSIPAQRQSRKAVHESNRSSFDLDIPRHNVALTAASTPSIGDGSSFRAHFMQDGRIGRAKRPISCNQFIRDDCQRVLVSLAIDQFTSPLFRRHVRIRSTVFDRGRTQSTDASNGFPAPVQSRPVAHPGHRG